jgi:hypothetical protein
MSGIRKPGTDPLSPIPCFAPAPRRLWPTLYRHRIDKGIVQTKCLKLCYCLISLVQSLFLGLIEDPRPFFVQFLDALDRRSICHCSPMMQLNDLYKKKDSLREGAISRNLVQKNSIMEMGSSGIYHRRRKRPRPPTIGTLIAVSLAAAAIVRRLLLRHPCRRLFISRREDQ